MPNFAQIPNLLLNIDRNAFPSHISGILPCVATWVSRAKTHETGSYVWRETQLDTEKGTYNPLKYKKVCVFIDARASSREKSNAWAGDGRLTIQQSASDAMFKAQKSENVQCVMIRHVQRSLV